MCVLLPILESCRQAAALFVHRQTSNKHPTHRCSLPDAHLAGVSRRRRGVALLFVAQAGCLVVFRQRRLLLANALARLIWPQVDRDFSINSVGSLSQLCSPVNLSITIAPSAPGRFRQTAVSMVAVARSRLLLSLALSLTTAAHQ